MDVGEEDMKKLDKGFPQQLRTFSTESPHIFTL